MKNYTLDAKRYTLTIGWLYPELMNTYGDRGNIICLQKRCEWRKIDCEVIKLNVGFKSKKLNACDLLFMGGAQDKQQKIVADDFSQEKIKVLKEVIENETPGLFICGAYQFLGKFYKDANGKIINCLNIIDLYTESPDENQPRLIGNIIIKLSTINHLLSTITLFGFENHGGRTYLGKEVKSLGDVLIGFGNNGKDEKEGMIYKNTFGTYLHGPILPKNPHFADLLIKIALEKKYKTEVKLEQLDDSLEWKAHHAIAKKLNIEL